MQFASPFTSLSRFASVAKIICDWVLWSKYLQLTAVSLWNGKKVYHCLYLRINPKERRVDLSANSNCRQTTNRLLLELTTWGNDYSAHMRQCCKLISIRQCNKSFRCLLAKAIWQINMTVDVTLLQSKSLPAFFLNCRPAVLRHRTSIATIGVLLVTSCWLLMMLRSRNVKAAVFGRWWLINRDTRRPELCGNLRRRWWHACGRRGERCVPAPLLFLPTPPRASRSLSRSWRRSHATPSSKSSVDSKVGEHLRGICQISVELWCTKYVVECSLERVWHLIDILVCI